ncbi:sulfite exporter TauE/SafE family protein [Rubrobacter indicoceani]|uniref:sulfite exporter TauE/SafE family protein n=1 Tax=Rubrobacter indicoceani TaxID=2051957 RepID=UPI000E5B06F5|nr:sulfite exporter TauE/SafE family protein [Rubrobacter indicoceani]
MDREPPRRSPGLAFLYGAPISLLGGLIGLGGAEFRLPVLVGVFRYAARRAVSLNLAISLITIASALAIRSGTLSLEPVFSLTPVILAMIAGAVTSAYVGVSLVHRISERLLERFIFVLLIVLGTGLVIESFLPLQAEGLLPDSLPVRLIAGVLFGLGIGLVSSLLGVAGGELIIPTLVFAFGADIRVAGTASLIISLPTVATGILRHARLGGYSDSKDLTGTVAPMGAGSVVGAVAGGLLVGLAPVGFLKLLLGVILMISAVRTFRHEK